MNIGNLQLSKAALYALRLNVVRSGVCVLLLLAMWQLL
jgi:hypothetical protein